MVAKLSGSQLQWFGILFHETSGYYHPLVLSNAVSKLTSFPSRLAMFPPRYTSASDSSLLEFVSFINFVIIIITTIIIIMLIV